MAGLRFKRGTRAQLDAAAGSGLLHAGEPYLVTDEGVMALGLGPGEYADVGSGGGGASTAAHVSYDPTQSGLDATDLQSALDAVVATHTGKLTANRTVNFDSSMTAAQIQSLIDQQPKNLNGYTLTFQFADGTYALGETLFFLGFFSGTLIIQGNAADTTAQLNKNVFVDFSGANCHGFEIASLVVVNVQRLRIKVNSSTANRAAIFSRGCTFFGCYQCSFEGTSTAYGYGALVRNGFGEIQVGYVTNFQIGLYCFSGSLFAYNTTSGAPHPITSLQVYAGTIYKTGVTIVGSEGKSGGGQIFS